MILNVFYYFDTITQTRTTILHLTKTCLKRIPLPYAMTTPATGPKSNLISSAMESLLTSNGSSAQVDTAAAEDWQDFLLQTMDAISGPLARHMLDRIGLLGTADDAAPLAPFRLLDHGCGLGIVASTLQKKVPSDVLQSSSIVCGDFSATLVDAVHKRIEKEGWTNCEARVVDAQVSGMRIVELGM